MIINGIPTIKEICFVLCLNKNKPIKTPKLPPITEIIKKVLSQILHCFFTALFLSMATRIRPMKFIASIPNDITYA